MSLQPIQIPSSLTPVIILARPQLGENIGATARAMKNCGLVSLRIVSPRDGWPNSAAEPMASNAVDILKAAKVYASLPDALQNITYLVATSARPRNMEKQVYTPRAAIAELLKHQKLQQKGKNCRPALLFGAERSGLENDELMLADCVTQVPLNPESMSLNLAQAVLLMAWEWRMATLAEGGQLPAGPEGLSDPADLKKRAFFMSRLQDVLEREGFFNNAEMASIVRRNLTCLLARSAPTDQELNTLHGILTLFQRNRETNGDKT